MSGVGRPMPATGAKRIETPRALRSIRDKLPAAHAQGAGLSAFVTNMDAFDALSCGQSRPRCRRLECTCSRSAYRAHPGGHCRRLAEARAGDHGHRDRRRALKRRGGAGPSAIDAVMAKMHRIDRTMSPHKDDSELTRINRGAGSAPVRLSDEMTSLGAGRELRPADRRRLRHHLRRRRPALRLPRRYPAEPRGAGACLPRGRLRACWRSTAAPAPFASPAPACASTSAASPRATRSTTPPGSCVPTASATRWSAPVATAASSATAAVGPGPSASVIRAAAAATWSLFAARGRLDLDFRRLRALLRRRRRALPSPHRSCHGRSPASVRSVTVLAEDGLDQRSPLEGGVRARRRQGSGADELFPGVDAIVVDVAGALHYSTGLVAPAAPARP